MSESILKALMQLFAIIARPVSQDEKEKNDYDDRRKVVEEFLKNQLNIELVKEYLKVFDYYYNLYQEKQSEKSKSKKRTSSSSVRVLKICSQINEELLQQQKIVVLIRLLEFVKPDQGEVTEQEMAFISTVAETFYVPENEFQHLKDFVLSGFDSVIPHQNILLINDSKEPPNDNLRHIYAEGLHEPIKILFVESANIFFLRYNGLHELYLNGHLLVKDKIFVLNNGSSIRNSKIKPIYFSDIVGRFVQDKIKEKIVFEAIDIEYRFKSGKIGLHPMSFVQESGHLVGIMGASGAGKTTLLNVLNGSEKPTKGNILINGIDIHNQKELVEGQIGFVSQDDLLIEELTVYQNLYFNARLCFDNYTHEQLEAAVNQTLQNLGLYEIKDMRVGSPLNKKISGGQRKRLNIALELIREPAILFLDEPTSGLSSRDSENILDLLKELTLKGKLVFVVIHQPSSEIFKMFDRLLILDTGGYLIYNGDPIESIIYFKSRVQQANWNESECPVCGNVNPEQIFNIVESNVLDEFGNPTRARKISPFEWNDYFKRFTPENPTPNLQPESLPKIHFKIPNWVKQLRIFVKRDILSKLANSQYMIINIFETPLLALLLSYIIKYYNVDVSNKLGYTLLENSNLPVYLFMSVIVGIFVGLTVSAEEIIKDRKILKREAFLNLSWSSYLMSKVTILLGISAFQALMFVVIGNSIMEIKGMYFEYWLVLFSTWFSANMMGLVISDSFKTVVTIYILIPFLVIPQIILSGIIVKYEKLNPTISSPSKIPIYGELIVSRWAYEALAVYQFKANRYMKPLYRFDEAMSLADYKRNYWLKSIQNKVDFCIRNLDDKGKKNEIRNALALIRNELIKEMTAARTSHLIFSRYTMLTPEEVNMDILKELNDFLEQLRKHYVKLYNKASAEKDSYITRFQNGQPNGQQLFIELKRRYHNESLSEFVRNSGAIERIIEYKNQLIQKIDPIYQFPESKFLRAHFYAPVKPFFGNYLDTIWVNVIVIWISSILMYLVLYYRLLKRFLEWLESLGGETES